MASQKMNDTSSRSHTLLHVDIYKQRLIDPATGQIENTQSRLVLVDLAGSERVRRTSSKGIRLDEAKHINASLSTLGTVIQALSQSPLSGVQKHIPFRSSKLTRVLQNCLGSNSKIALLATIGPHHRNF